MDTEEMLSRDTELDPEDVVKTLSTPEDPNRREVTLAFKESESCTPNGTDGAEHGKTEGDSTQEEEGEHRWSRGGETIPRIPLENSLAYPIVACGFISMLSGLSLTILGIFIHGEMARMGEHPGPPLWWTGALPLVLGLSGVYQGAMKQRQWILFWGFAILLTAITQTAVMGVVGNFTMSNYEVWPLMDTYHDKPLCEVKAFKCYCQDYFFGAYSKVELKSVNYLYLNGTKWRETQFSKCNLVVLLSELYYATVGSLIVFQLVSIVGCILAFKVSVCAKHMVNFRRLRESMEDVATEDIYSDAQGDLGGQAGNESQNAVDGLARNRELDTINVEIHNLPLNTYEDGHI